MASFLASDTDILTIPSFDPTVLSISLTHELHVIPSTPTQTVLVIGEGLADKLASKPRSSMALHKACGVTFAEL